jgi:hypothetical protein
MIGDPVRVELRCDSVLALNPVLVPSELVLVLSGTVLVLVIEPVRVLAPSEPVLLIELGLFFSNVVSIMTFLSTKPSDTHCPSTSDFRPI